MAKLVIKISIYDDETMVIESEKEKIETHTNPETLTAMMLFVLGAIVSMGGRK